MISTLNTAQKTSIGQMNRTFPYSGGFVQFILDILNTLTGGAFGIQSAANDVDSLAYGGGSFSIDTDNTAGTSPFSNGLTGLTFAWLAGRFHNGMTEVSVAGGSLTMAASSTNYVELDRNGTVYANNSAFTSGRMPLYQVTTSSSSITAVAVAKALMTIIGPAGVTGTMLSTAANTRNKEVQIGGVSATTVVLTTAPVTGTLIAASLVNSTAITSNNTNYWTLAIVNLGQSNAGTQAMLANTAANTTKATGGSSMGANTPFAQALANTSLAVTKGDVLQITLTATASPTALTETALNMDFSFTA